MQHSGAPSKVKFLTVIWGERYIEEFARVSLPSYLAPGNLPALAAAEDLEILIMTAEGGEAFFERLEIFRQLKYICPVRFIYIDDLITNGNYGVTLTYAYARGIMDSGEAQTDTCFVFMNADFVLADGSLRTLVDKIRDGHNCIMAPSLRACAEPTFARLLQSVDPEKHTLTMAPRDMVQLAFDNLHPTVVGKTMTQRFLRCMTYNQLYWQVDEHTLLGRYHLIFMQAIRPEVPLTTVNSYCDYGFVPEMVPSGRFHILDDSDEFFLLELQPTAAEREYLYCGTPPLGDISSALSLWTTKEHRAFAGVDVVFHTRDLPANLPAVKAEAASFIREVQSEMRPEPLSHVDHYYWVLGVQSWETLRTAQRPVAESIMPRVEEMHTPPKNISWREWISRGYLWFIGWVRRQTGAKPNVAIWHHLWLDSQLALDWARERRGKSGRVLVIGEANNPIPTHLARRASAIETTREAFMGEDVPEGTFDAILLHIYRMNVLQTGAILEKARGLLAEGGKISVFVEHTDSETDQSNFTAELAQYVNHFFPSAWMSFDIRGRFTGGRAKRMLRLMERTVLRRVIPHTRLQIPIAAMAVVAWPLLGVATLLNNLRARRKSTDGSHHSPQYCSSALIEFQHRGGRRTA